MTRIKIIFIDIEGTLTPGKLLPLDLEGLMQIQAIGSAAEKAGILLTISTGRPQPYVESMLQAIGGKTWAICENGALIYHPMEDRSILNTKIPRDFLATKTKMELKLHETLDQKYRGWRKELGKEFILSVNPPLDQPIEEFFNAIETALSGFQNVVLITHSRSAVDIAPRGISKMDGIKNIDKLLGITQEETAGIGDSNNDLEMLQYVGLPGVPANADKLVKETVQARKGFIAKHSHTQGTLDFIHHCLNMDY